MIKIHGNAIMKSHLSRGFTCFYFVLLSLLSLQHQYTHTYRQDKFKSKIMIFLPASSDVFIYLLG